MTKVAMFGAAKGRTLMGKILSENESGYEVEVISYESKSDKAKLGKRYFVQHQFATISYLP